MKKLLAILICMSMLMACIPGFGVSAASIPQTTEKETMDVWLIAGQSNAMGMGPVAGYPSDSAYAEYKTVFTGGASDVWYFGNNDTDFASCGFMGKTYVGPELGIVSSVTGESKKSAVIKVAWGNTSLYNNTSSEQSKQYGTWTPPSYIKNHNINTDGNKVGDLYYTFLEKVDIGLQKIEEKGYIPNIRGIWYMQGEADTFSEAPAAAYAELLETFISDMRNDLTEVSGVNCSELPFVYGRVLRNPGIDPDKNAPYADATPYVAQVQAAQDSVAAKNIKNVFMINTTTDLVDPVTKEAKAPVQVDGWHYDAFTQQMIGEKFVATVKANTTEDGTVKGEGTDASPFIIDTAEKFVQIFGKGTTADLTKVYLLTGFGRTPLELPSTYRAAASSFNGKLLGGNLINGEIVPVAQKINFNIAPGTEKLTVSSNNYQGVIFHHLDKATVSNLELSGKVTAGNNWFYFGVLSGYISGATIDNVVSYVEIDSKTGRGTGVISGRSAASGTVKNTVTNCANYGNIKITDGTNNNVGGLIGDMSAALLTSCFNHGDITGGSASSLGTNEVGGISGYLSSDSVISKCGNYGNISIFSKDLGGISGRAGAGAISETFNAGNIANGTNEGAIHGRFIKNLTANISNCFNVGKITDSNSRGLVSGSVEAGSKLVVKGYYDAVNKDISSVAGTNSGTLDVTSAYVISDTSEVKENDAQKVLSSNLSALTETDEIFKKEDIWVKKFGYDYPNLVNNMYQTPSQAGSGTDEDPYIIDTADKFMQIFANGSTADLTKVYLLTGFDENALEVPSGFVPQRSAFSGKLIGGNIENGVVTPVKQKINLNVTLTASDKIDQYAGGLFHKVNNAKISNLALYGTLTVPSIAWNGYIGVLAGDSTGTGAAVHTVISNVDNHVKIIAKENYGYGGIIGKAEVYTEILNSNNYGDITATGASNRAMYVGGIVGEAFRCTVKDCDNYGTISGNINVGGIAGFANAYPIISNCANFGNVSSSRTDTTATYVGGIIGLNHVNISNCYNMGNISGKMYAGGIIGTHASGKTASVSNCYNTGVIDGDKASGLVAGNVAGTLTVAGFYDIANASIESVAGAKSGTLTVTDAYGYSEVEKTTENDVSKTSHEAIAALTTTNDVFNKNEVWTKSSDFIFPNLSAKLYNKPFVGSGNENDPYRIYCVNELKNVENYPSASFIQMNDIKGMDTMLCREIPFSGVYNGNGHSIALAIDDSANETYPKFVGLFARSAGLIKNLTATGEINAGYIDWKGGAGAFVGEGSGNTGKLENCINYATINSTGHQTAGIIGRTANKFTIYKCFNYGDITGDVKAAGIVGLLDSGVNMYYCGNYGDIVGGEAAGLTTWSYTYAQVYNCFNVGNITAIGKNGIATGLIGNISNGNTVTNIKDSFNAGALNGNTTYGICYSNANKTKDYNIINCYNAVGADYPLAGGTAVATIKNSYYLADASDASENAMTPAELKNAASTLGSTVWSIAGDYEYPQITKNALNAEKDNIEFVLITINKNLVNSDAKVLVSDADKFYAKKGAAVSVAVVPGAYFYCVDIANGENVVFNGISEEKTVNVIVDGDSVISISDKAIEAEIPEIIDSTSSVIGSEEGGVYILNDALYTKYILVASKIPAINGLKLKSFGVYAAKDEAELINDANRIPADAGKIAKDGSFGILIFSRSNNSENLISVGGVTVPYAVYEDVTGKEVEIKGNVSEF